MVIFDVFYFVLFFLYSKVQNWFFKCTWHPYIAVCSRVLFFLPSPLFPSSSSSFFMLNLPSSTLSISVQIWGALKLLFPPVIVLDKSSSSYRSEVRVGMLWGMESFTTSQSSSSHKPTCLEINTNAKRETQLSAVVHTFPLKTLSDIFLGCSRKKKML